MSTSSAVNSVPGVVTFTARGNAALDQLAEALAADCSGSPTSIADILERVLQRARQGNRLGRYPRASHSMLGAVSCADN